MASQAQYRVSIPAVDNLGQAISHHFPVAAHHWLHHAHPRLFQGSWIEGPHRGMWENEPSELMHHLVTTTEDGPEADSHIKQLASHIGQAANQWGVYVQKTGDNGIDNWVINNPNYIEGQGAHPAILEPGPLAGSWSPDHHEVTLPGQPRPFED